MPILEPYVDETWNRYSQDEQKELIREYAGLRKLLANPLASMHAQVLKPICNSCLRPWPEVDDPPITYGPIHPPREHIYLYPANPRPRRKHHYFPSYGTVMASGRIRYPIECYVCHQEMDDLGVFHVVEESFQRHFCFEDESRGLPKWLRRHILDVYGNQCFMCNEELSISQLTIDHIIPKCRGGTSRPTNLQPMCAKCNNDSKKDADPEEHYIFLDFLLRSPPRDAYSGLIW